MLISCLANPVVSISAENNVSTQLITQNINLEADLKIRIAGGDWIDGSFSSEVGKILDFKINVQTETDYEIIAVKVELPESNNQPMFNYIIGSVDPKPTILDGGGMWLANDTDVVWAWFNTEESWSKEMTFSAKINKGGSGDIDLAVIASKKNDDSCDEAFDSIHCNIEKSRFSYKIRSPILLFRNLSKFLFDCNFLF